MGTKNPGIVAAILVMPIRTPKYTWDNSRYKNDHSYNNKESIFTYDYKSSYVSPA